LKSGIKAGCLALGMATAWGGEACGDPVSHITINSTVGISNAYLFYANNVTSADVKSLGNLTAGATTLSQWDFTPGEDAYGDNGTGHRPTYMMIGLYDYSGNPGVVVSFPNSYYELSNKQWADFFQSTPGHEYDRTEAQVVGYLQSAATDFSAYCGVCDFLRDFGNSRYDVCGHPCATEYGQMATLVGFSGASLIGRVTVDVVPEPATWVLLIGAAGALLFWRRDLVFG
jgi:hypothetical protein